MQKTLTKLKKHFSDASDVREAEAFWVDGRLIVSKRFMEKFFGVVGRSVTGWIQRGMPGEIRLDARTPIYDFPKVLAWHTENIETSKGMGRKANAPVTAMRGAVGADAADAIDPATVDLSTATLETLDRLKAIEDVTKKRIDNAVAKGKLISAEDTDRAMAEQAALHVAQYRSDLKLLPTLLENKSKDEISEILDAHYKSRVEDLHKIFTSKGEKETLWDYLKRFITTKGTDAVEADS